MRLDVITTVAHDDLNHPMCADTVTVSLRRALGVRRAVNAASGTKIDVTPYDPARPFVR